MRYQTFLDAAPHIVALVEASNFEQSTCWKEYAKEAANFRKSDGGTVLDWPSTLHYGWLLTVGEIDGRPICVSVTLEEIEGRVVVFWEPTSQVVDHKQIDAYFKEFAPTAYKVDANNFHNAVDHIQRLNKAI